MSIITKERAQQIFLGNGPEPTASEERELARIALASLEAEPVGCDACGGNGSVDIDHGEMGIEHIECPKCYTAPPAPVSVPDDVSGPLAHAYKELTPTFMRNHIDVFERYGIYPDGSAGIQAMRIALDGMNRRAAMLQGAEPVTTAYKLPEGYVLVPVELTGAMTNAMTDAILDDLHNVDVWRSVLAAAPWQEVKS